MSQPSSNSSQEERIKLNKEYVIVTDVHSDLPLDKYLQHAKDLFISGAASFKGNNLSSAYIDNKKVLHYIRNYIPNYHFDYNNLFLLTYFH
jgi:hypothetical protein